MGHCTASTACPAADRGPAASPAASSTAARPVELGSGVSRGLLAAIWKLCAECAEPRLMPLPPLLLPVA